MTFPYLPATRCAGIAPARARAVLVCLFLAILLGLWTGVATPKAFRAPPKGLEGGDGALYARIVDDVAAGQGYYDAAVSEQRRWGYTLNPALTVRLPTLAVFLSWFPDAPSRRSAFLFLAALTLLGWGWRTQSRFGRPLFTALVVLSLSAALLIACYGQTYLFHECWAGMLMALSLALYDSRHPGGRRWGPSLALGLAAVLVRELAAPYLVVMAGFAVLERRPKEALAWAAALVCFGLLLLAHAHFVAIRTMPGDPVSRGWLAFGGWAYSLLTMHWNALLLLAPGWGFAVLVPLMAFGALVWPGAEGRRLAALCAGYLLGFTVCGRLDTSYWGLTIAPLTGVALAMAPGGLSQLVRAALPRPSADDD